MRDVDRRAIEAGLPGLLLMEAAAIGVLERLRVDFPDELSRSTVVLCGKGNNGGDGVALARHLRRLGLPVEAWLVDEPDQLSGDAATQVPAALASGVRIRILSSAETWADATVELAQAGLVVDALLGTGVRGGARGIVADAIRALARRRGPVAAIDLPSGLDADAARAEGVVVRATRTYTLCRPKRGLLERANEPWVGTWSVVPIGVADSFVEAAGSAVEWLDESAVAPLIPERPVDAHKGRFGHVLVLAGSVGKAGAAVLAARGALRGGAGLVTVGTPEAVRAEIAVAQPEAMTAALPEGEAATEAWLGEAESRAAVVIGPGLGRQPSTLDAVVRFQRGHRGVAVFDADALFAFPGCSGLMAAAPRVLTPHPGEAARLLGRSIDEVQANRDAAALEIASRTRAVTVLKGDRTVVACPSGRLAINSTGNPGMATGGTGDVLAGLIGAFLAGGVAPWDAARLAVYTHGAAGDLAAAELGGAGILAGDVANALPRALLALHCCERDAAW